MNKIIIIIVGVVIALILAVVLVWPKYQTLQALNSNIENRKEELRSQEAYFSRVREISAQLQEHRDAFSKISNALPKDPSLASLANFLQTNSAQTGLILKKMVFSGAIAPSKGEGSLAETQIALQVSGSYKAFKDFLSLIEGSARLFEAQNISIGIAPKESKESPTFTLDLKVNSY